MKNSRAFLATAVVAAALALLFAGAAPLRAQQIGPVITLDLSRPQGGPVWVKAEIVHADSHSMVVRQHGHELAVYTFTYAQPLQPKMEKIAENGGYQYGDHVKILYNPGQLVALKIHGKPSKPI